MAKTNNGEPCYSKTKWAIPHLRTLNGGQAKTLTKLTGITWANISKKERPYDLRAAKELTAGAFTSDLKVDTIVAYWIATTSWPIEMHSQAAHLHQNKKGKKKGTAAAATASNDNQPTEDTEEAVEEPAPERKVVQDDEDPSKLLVHTVNPTAQALVIEGNVVTMDTIRSAMSNRGDDDRSLGGADEPWPMGSDRRKR